MEKVSSQAPFIPSFSDTSYSVSSVAKHFGLTDEEMNAWYPSGNGEIFLDRISWALSYLFIAGLVEKPQRGDYFPFGK